MRVILIAGGAGFVGSHLCDYYIGNSVVYCVDNLSTGSKNNIKHLLIKSNFHFIQHDIIEPLPSEFEDINFDIIVNLASPASPPHYRKLAVETLLVGSVGTKNLLDLAREKNARFFHASTSEVYGDPQVHPQTESYLGNVNCYGPRSMYDESKRFGESLIYVYKKDFGVDTVIARFFNTYGPRMDIQDGRVITNFIYQALCGEDITVYGDGSQTRSFCYISDLITAVVKLIDSDQSDPVNLGNATEFSISQLVNKVISVTGSTSGVTCLPLPGDDPKLRKPDIGLATDILGWTPTVQLEEGLTLTVEYFRQLINDQ